MNNILLFLLGLLIGLLVKARIGVNIENMIFTEEEDRKKIVKDMCNCLKEDNTYISNKTNK